MRFVIAAFLALMLPTLSFAADKASAKEKYSFDAAFVRATPMKMSAGYVTITNPTKNADILVEVKADWARRIEMHDMVMKDDVMEMKKLQQVDVPAKGDIVFAPSGKHLMIFDIDKPLKVGQTVKITFVFRDAGSVTVPFSVKPISYKGGH